MEIFEGPQMVEGRMHGHCERCGEERDLYESGFGVNSEWLCDCCELAMRENDAVED